MGKEQEIVLLSAAGQISSRSHTSLEGKFAQYFQAYVSQFAVVFRLFDSNLQNGGQMNNPQTEYAKKTLRIAQAAKNATCPMSDTPSEQPEALKRLFAKMTAGEHPDFLDVMAAISNMVAFYSDCDINSGEEQTEEFLMSQNNCRFCP